MARVVDIAKALVDPVMSPKYSKCETEKPSLICFILGSLGLIIKDIAAGADDLDIDTFMRRWFFFFFVVTRAAGAEDDVGACVFFLFDFRDISPLELRECVSLVGPCCGVVVDFLTHGWTELNRPITQGVLVLELRLSINAEGFMKADS